MLDAKKTVALLVLTSWLLLAGICFSENLGYFDDTSEHSDQTVEQVFSSPVEISSHQLPELQISTDLVGLAAVNGSPILQSIPSTFSILLTREDHSPSGNHRLFKLFSTYRI